MEMVFFVQKAEAPAEPSPSTTEKAEEEPKEAEMPKETEAAVPEILPAEEAAPQKEAEAEDKIEEIKTEQ